MIRGTIRALGLTVALAAGSAPSAQSPAPPRFRVERTVAVTASGPQRLEVDVALLAGANRFTIAARADGPIVRHVASGGLSDLRLYNAAGAEVPYLLVPPPVTPRPPMAAGTVLPVTSTETANAKSSGFEVDLGRAMMVDALQLDGIPPPFLKRFTLEGSGDRQRWTQLVAEGTAFDLPAEELRHTTLEFPAGTYRYLRVTWDDTNSGRVPPPSFVSGRPIEREAPPPPPRVPLTFERRASEPGQSRFRIQLPGAGLPVVALHLTVGGANLLRSAEVMESRLEGDQARPASIGRARLRRSMRDGLSAEALAVPIQRPTEAQLDLVVDDGDNPSLDLTGVTAVFAELPWIYFESAPGMLTARYGDPALGAPRYDLEAARSDLPASVAKAAWASAPLLSNVPDPAPMAMPELGAAIEVKDFPYVREIPAGPAGLVTVPLDAHALANSAAGRFADVRVLDPGGLQVPYLLERRGEPLTIDLTIERRELPEAVSPRDARRTSYAVTLPFETLPEARLVVATRARVFQRPVVVALLVPPDERRREPRLQTIESRVWTHANPDTPARPFTVAVPERRQGELILIVDEGDNQPLPIEKVTLLLPSYAVRLFRPADVPLRLAYGQPALRQPRYDLALLAPQVMGRIATEATAAGESTAATRAPSLQIVPPAVFWTALGVAVVVLLALVVRLVRREAA